MTTPHAEAGTPPAEPFHWEPEHEEFRGVVRKLTASRAPLACAPSPKSDDPRERELWRSWAEEVGLPGLVVPERHGGAGFTRLEMAIAAEELGRSVVGGPLFSSAVLATEALLALEQDETAAAVLPSLAAGESVAALAVLEESRRWRPEDVATAVSGNGDRLSGDKQMVVGAADADHLVVAAQEDAGVSLFLVETDAAGVEIAPCEVLDPSRPIASVRLREAPARRV
ncbi:acyl-CoA dehydrogenase, partial [Actinomadura sp. KC345]|uniref:acyl-CoA dehydrogenase family protein n=1 Tax=Actinomadura sp. KC345 TaxID=2530371 RepID=UPI0010518FE2